MTFSAVNTIWVLVGAALVFFMQAGFSLCEAGFTRAKNTGNILMKNLMDFCIGTPCFWLVGFGIMFGSGTALFGTIDPLILGDYSHILPAGVPLWAYAIFQTVFCATSATIVSGAMAERRLAFAAGLPRFRRFHRGAHGGRPVRFDRRQNPGTPHWQV